MRNLKWRLALMVCSILLSASGSYAEWTKTNLPDGGIVTSMAVVGTDLFAATHKGVYRTTDNGAHWVVAGLVDAQIVGMAGDNGRLFAATKTGLFTSDDLGQTWSRKGPTTEVMSVSFGEGRLWAAFRISAPPYITVNYSTDYGDHWTSTGGSGSMVYSVLATGNKVFLAASNGVFTAELTDSGYTDWYSILNQSSIHSLAIANSKIYATCYYGNDGVLVSEDMGSFQAPSNIGLTSRGVFSIFVDGTDLYVGTTAGAFRSSDGCATWTGVGLENTQVMAFARIGNALFAGTGGGVSVSTDGGTSWTVTNNGLQGIGLHDITSQGSDLLLATTSGLFRSSDAGDSWSHVALENNYCLTALLVNDTIYIGTTAGILRSIDNGVTWTEHSNGMNAHDRSILALATSPSGTLFAASEAYAYRSTDHGENWETLNEKLTTSAKSFLATESYVLAGTYIGVYRSTDDGLNWTRVLGVGSGGPELHYHAGVMAKRGSEIYTGGYYGSFVSYDDGLTWAELDRGLPDTYVRDLTVDGTNLYISTVAGIYLLPQGGTAWIPINSDGLADTDIHEILVHNSEFFAISSEGLFYPTYDPDPMRSIWKRPVSEVNCCQGTYGNINQMGVVDLSDLSYLVSYLTGAGTELPCLLAANVSGTGIVDLTDMSALVSYLTGGGYVMPNCP